MASDDGSAPTDFKVQTDDEMDFWRNVFLVSLKAQEDTVDTLAVKMAAAVADHACLQQRARLPTFGA